mmetsp:Transcript_7454/g.10117  ORF Transcript_7454/g.10117 Transcript_7454/m.10117 type:complete len:319 (-) Transcript_7454:222-1178(-)|eukprot:CAMPEP_0185737254 /NCGR_PEP_ID=MMETSP1171-20130828/29974_1 /TAXON_ID=374046 /ORGANISM="Helicotheca tamensis, Strain CCMP826" /LENGTH=318 /DNA_ID=CAMNT_0028408129 /DNA_START=85 /DNA_END=1041 /DNA_ORIENTATION=-
MKLSILASALVCLIHSSDAFTAPSGLSVKAPSAFVSSGRNARFSVLSMATEEAKTTDPKGPIAADELEDCQPEEGEYCPIDEKTGQPLKLTLAEKEKIFVDALQSYYISGKQSLDDADFDLLKEDLSWNGSKVVQMNRKEARYLASVESYLKGNPIMSDEEFDTLKKELKAEGSRFAVSEEPKCVIDTGICTVTLKDDNFRSNLIYLPATAVLTVVWLGFGFELIEPFVRLNPLFLTLLGSPLIYRGTKKITDEYIFPGNKIVYGPCPNCEAEQRVYFGDILGIEGFKDVATVKCTNCKTQFTVQKDTLRATTTTPKK